MLRKWPAESVYSESNAFLNSALFYRDRRLRGRRKPTVRFQDAYPEAIVRVRRSAVATLLYSNDTHDTLSRGVNWMDAVMPCVRDGEAFRSPGVPAPGYGSLCTRILRGISSANPAIR